MNSSQIDRALKDKCRGQFLGVYSVNNLPKTLPTRRPLMLVCNTHPDYRPGEHWIAMYIDDDDGYYFDSFGQKPKREFELFMNKHCTFWNCSDRQLQSLVSYFCGQYCVFYCMYRSIGLDSNAIYGLFTNDTGLNDWLVHNFVCKALNVV